MFGTGLAGSCDRFQVINVIAKLLLRELGVNGPLTRYVKLRVAHAHAGGIPDACATRKYTYQANVNTLSGNHWALTTTQTYVFLSCATFDCVTCPQSVCQRLWSIPVYKTPCVTPVSSYMKDRAHITAYWRDKLGDIPQTDTKWSHHVTCK